MPSSSYTPRPWPYFLVRLLFKFILKIFYGTIVVENADVIPDNGQACIICANHSNSLTDAVLLVGSIPSNKRNFLRLTAKSTLFGKKTFTSWLTEAVGTVPLKRRKDFPDIEIDNSDAMEELKQVLECGDTVCLFPEGISRFHPTLAPLKTGAARLISGVLTRKKNDPSFKIYLQLCSITYMHRQYFRSDVFITFHSPILFTAKSNPELIAPVDFSHIRALTTHMQRQISSGTFDAPSWDIVRNARIAARMYAPLGTRMTLGDYVRVCRAFVEVFKWAESQGKSDPDASSGVTSDLDEEDEEALKFRRASINALQRDLKEYQDQLSLVNIKDDRLRRALSRHEILWRICIRLAMLAIFIPLMLPGLLLWLPIFVMTREAVKRLARTGPVCDTWDEIAQTKLVWGLAAGVSVWVICIVLTLPLAFVTVPAIPALMWMTLRWLEDAIAATRALRSLVSLLWLGNARLRMLYTKRQALYIRVMELAVRHLNLPNNPEIYFLMNGGREKGRVRGAWEEKIEYFSVKRRRKRDWNETLRLYDVVDYPQD